MDVRILRYFLAVAREENITRAAESLHITQPSLSKQLMELEQELGKQLLIRGKRKVTLTDEGIFLRKRAEDIVSLVEKTEHDIASDFAEVSGEIAIGGNASESILKVASSMKKQHPDISFQFYSGDATDVIEQLDHGSVDFAILLQPIDTTKYEFIPLPDKSIWGVLMKKDCEFSNLPAITRDAFVKMPLILHRRIGLQQMIAHWAQINLEQLNITATYNVVHGSPVPFVKNNLGYFLITRDLLSPELDSSVTFIPLDPPLEIRYNLAWKRHNVFSKASKLFLDKIKGANYENN